MDKDIVLTLYVNIGSFISELSLTNLIENSCIRRNILGGRINYSARTVIVPNAKLKSYQIGLPYVAFVELYKEVIINLLVKLDGYDYSEAVNQWYNAYRDFDPKIYKVIQYILKHGKPKVLLNRNPKQFMWGI